MNDDTFEEKFSFRLTRTNVFVALGAAAIILIFGTTYLIAFTPLKQYIPDYASDVHMREQFLALSAKTDSMEQNLKEKDLYILNIKNVIEGKEILFELPKENPDSLEKKMYDTIKLKKSLDDSLLRMDIEEADKYALFDSDGSSGEKGINSYFFFTPLKGFVVNGFNPSEKHYGIDIAAKTNEAVKATLDGVVIFTEWTLETGNVIAVQHANNIVSIYKHNSTLLKKQGTYVKAGEAIAIVGNSGERTSGPHLHFELWYDGTPINPKDYMVF